MVKRQFKLANKIQKKLIKKARTIAQPISNKVFNVHFHFKNKKSQEEIYFISKEINPKKNDIAVVLHLYYTDNWAQIFNKKLLHLERSQPFDLYVTMPLDNEAFASVIKDTFPEANILIVPNRGRDVLPFIKTASILLLLGYQRVLKLHSKKSSHRDIEGNAAEAGGIWLTNTVNALIPEDTKRLYRLTSILSRDEFGILGPEQYYYPIKMYLTRNRRSLEMILHTYKEALFSEDTAEKLDHYGYFGGTMFWINLESIRDVTSVSKDNFEVESGQTDGTIAHALERAFSLLPQLEGKKVYGASDESIKELKEANFPSWYYEDLFISGGRPHTSIIVPVYGDWASLNINIHSLKDVIGNREDVAVYYVNDCGPEADMIEANIKAGIDGIANMYYVRNKKNLGFVKNCNNAVFNIVPKEDDVLLLNSDTKVTNNFFNHMRDVLYSENNIGAVTARSNNATIWSVPMTARLAEQRLASYILYRWIKRSIPEKYISPTIHGFCVLIRRKVIDKLGLFDEVYGSGYGEENDFAMRIRNAGWKCAVANYAFVFHYESRSFGNEARRIQIEKNEKVLIKRYPNYRQLVQEYWDSIKEPLK